MVSKELSGIRVLSPIDTKGLPDELTTLPEALKELGYKTGFNGKWHLGMIFAVCKPPSMQFFLGNRGTLGKFSS